MNHPDFRVKGKIFATLGPDEDWGMLKLTSEQQAAMIAVEPDAFKPANGAWGKHGATIVTLKLVEKKTVEGGMLMAWHNTAPQQLIDEWEGDEGDQ